MKIFFYHTEDVQYIYQGWQRGTFPGHFLYGATHLAEHGIEMVMRRHHEHGSRLGMMLDTARQILFCKERFDAVYATHYKGLELIIFMRALHLFGKPIIIWHHQPIITPSKRWREWLGRLFYRGIDEMFFFSRKLVDDSLATRKARPEHMHVGHWGPDLDFYDRIISQQGESRHTGFISTGRERRDMPTLVNAFNETGETVDIYLNRKNCGIDYEAIFRSLRLRDNVHVHFTEGYQQDKLCIQVYHSLCVVICCMETKYTVGLTTVVEAMALGLPVICSRNPQIPIDFDKEGCGISVPYYDLEGWKHAVSYIASHPEEAAQMGRRARELAESLYNDRKCAAEVAAVIKGTQRRQR